jgi:hypothetical protein
MYHGLTSINIQAKQKKLVFMRNKKFGKEFVRPENRPEAFEKNFVQNVSKLITNRSVP